MKTRIKKDRLSLWSGMAMAVVFLSYIAVGGFADGSNAAVRQGGFRPVPCAEAESVQKQDIRIFPGTIRASQRVELAFSVSGLLVELNAQEGACLRQGEVLARLDPMDYQHALDIVRATHADAKRSYERAVSLKEDKVVSEAEYDQAVAVYARAEAELRIKEKALSDTVLRAPFDGVVSRRYVETHEHIQDRKAVVSFQDISRVEVLIQIPEKLAVHDFHESLGVLQVSLDEHDATVCSWMDAEISEFSVQSDPVTHTYDVVVSFIPPDRIRLLPGMHVTVRSCTGDASDQPADHSCVYIPFPAIWGGNHGETYVWVIPPHGGMPHRRRVEAGRICKEGVEIIRGLEPGEFVAVAGVHVLHEDLKVRPMMKDADGLDG